MLRLYGTKGCHLCDRVEAWLAQAGASRPLEWQYVDIALDDGLVDRYGTRIPVLALDGSELSWPFTLLDIVQFMAGDSGTDA